MSGSDPEDELSRLQAELQAHLAAMSRISSRFEAVRTEWNEAVAVRTDLLDRVATAKVAGDDQPDWGWLLATGNGAVADKALGRAAAAIGLQADGYYPDIRQNALSLRMTRDDRQELETAIAGIRTVLPHLRTNEAGLVQFGILESTLNSHGTWSLLIRPEDGSCVLSRNQWEQERFSDIETAVTYIQENHWYDEVPRPAMTR